MANVNKDLIKSFHGQVGKGFESNMAKAVNNIAKAEAKVAKASSKVVKQIANAAKMINPT